MPRIRTPQRITSCLPMRAAHSRNSCASHAPGFSRPGSVRRCAPNAAQIDARLVARPMKTLPMKVGIVGSGLISGHHLRAVSNYANCQIVGIADRELARAQVQAERFKVPHTFESLGPLLALKPDVVHVLTPPD